MLGNITADWQNGRSSLLSTQYFSPVFQPSVSTQCFNPVFQPSISIQYFNPLFQSSIRLIQTSIEYSILFSFQRKLIHEEVFVRDTRSWLDVLVRTDRKSVV